MHFVVHKKAYFFILLIIMFIAGGCSMVNEGEALNASLPWQIIETFPQEVIVPSAYKGAKALRYIYDYNENTTLYEVTYKSTPQSKKDDLIGQDEERVKLQEGVDGYNVLTIWQQEKFVLDTDEFKRLITAFIPPKIETVMVFRNMTFDFGKGTYQTSIQYSYVGPTKSILDVYKSMLDVQMVVDREDAFVIQQGTVEIVINKNQSLVTLISTVDGTTVDVEKSIVNGSLDDVKDESATDVPEFKVDDLSQLDRYRIILDIEQMDTKPGEIQVYNEYIVNEPLAFSVVTEIFNARGEKTGTIQSVEVDGKKFMKVMEKPWQEGQALRISHIQLSGLYIALSQAKVIKMGEETIETIPCVHYSFDYQSVNQKAGTKGEIWIANDASLPQIPVKGFYEQTVADENGNVIEASHVKVNFLVKEINSGEEISLPTP